MSDKKKKSRKEYLNDFRLNASGKYDYEGVLFRFREDTISFRGFLSRLWILSLISLAAFVASGMLPAPGMGNCAYVLLPYTLGLIASVFVCWTVFRLSAGRNPMRAYIYRSTVEKLPVRSLVTAGCAGITFIGELIYVAGNGMEGSAGYFAGFLVLEVAALISALLVRRLIMEQVWEEDKRTSF